MTIAWDATRMIVERGFEPSRPLPETPSDEAEPWAPHSAGLPFTVVLRSPGPHIDYQTVLLHASTWHDAVSLALEDRQDCDVCAVFPGHHTDVWND